MGHFSNNQDYPDYWVGTKTQLAEVLDVPVKKRTGIKKNGMTSSPVFQSFLKSGLGKTVETIKEDWAAKTPAEKEERWESHTEFIEEMEEPPGGLRGLIGKAGKVGTVAVGSIVGGAALGSIFGGGSAATAKTASGLSYIPDAALPATLQPATVATAGGIGGLVSGVGKVAGGTLSVIGKVAGGALDVAGKVAGGTLDVLGGVAGGTLDVLGDVAAGLPGLPGQADQPIPGQAGQPILVMPGQPGQPIVVSQPASGDKVSSKLVLYVAGGVGVMLIAFRMIKK